jgi:fermentation-respiration switch protein FrsA (DUF1100 family)
MKKILTRLAVPASILLAGCSSTDESPRSTSMLVDSVLFHPDRYPVGKWKTEDPSIEDVYFESPDGQKLNGWYTEAKNARAIVLYAEGNGGNITNRRAILDLYRDKLKCTILIFDYEGYGRSEGKPSQSAILADARSARTWLSDRAGIDEKDIVLVGNSLGGAVAVDLAVNGGARGLVLENTFASLSELTQAHFGLMASKLVSSKLDSASKIDDYHGPLLQAHGENDKTVPFAQGKRLFEAANEPKKFIPIPGGGHNDEPSEEYIEELDKFLASLPEVSAKTTR